MDSLGCIRSGCKTIRRQRGLCGRHYQAARKKVREGKTTWEKLAKKGLILSRKKNPYFGSIDKMG